MGSRLPRLGALLGALGAVLGHSKTCRLPASQDVRMIHPGFLLLHPVALPPQDGPRMIQEFWAIFRIWQRSWKKCPMQVPIRKKFAD